MYSNEDLVRLLEENTLDFLLLDYDGAGLDIARIEDQEVAIAMEEAAGAIMTVRHLLADAETTYYGGDDDSDD